MALTKEQILAATKNIKVVTVTVVGLGEVCLRSLKGWQRDQLDVWASREGKDLTHYRARLISQSLCDADGKSLDFTEEDIIELSDASAGMLEPLFDECRKLSGIGQQDVKELEKNSKGQSGNSGGS